MAKPVTPSTSSTSDLTDEQLKRRWVDAYRQEQEVDHDELIEKMLRA